MLGTSQAVGWCTCVKCYNVCLRASKAASRPVLNAKDTFKPVEKEDANNFIWYLGFCGPKLPSTVRMLPYQTAFAVKRYILKSTQRSRFTLRIIDLIFTDSIFIISSWIIIIVVIVIVIVIVLALVISIIILQLLETIQRQRRPVKTSHSITLCSEQPKTLSTYVAFQKRHKAVRRWNSQFTWRLLSYFFRSSLISLVFIRPLEELK